MAKNPINIRMDDEDYHFLSVLAKEEQENISKKVGELVDLGRVMLGSSIEVKRSKARE